MILLAIPVRMDRSPPTGALVAFIRRSPLVGVDDLDLERSSDFTRDMEL